MRIGLQIVKFTDLLIISSDGSTYKKITNRPIIMHHTNDEFIAPANENRPTVN